MNSQAYQFSDRTPSLTDQSAGAGSNLYRRFGKRALDLALVLAFAPIVIFVVAILAMMVALDGSNPFYSQSRVGRNGRLFRIWKLRTMVVDADEQLKTLLASDPQAALEWEATQKLRVDPRITRAGHFLRRASLDELPQLYNVLVGDMSLVGPRPMMPEQRSLYPGREYYRLAPGLTGLWQVSERNSSTFEARASYDAAYERGLSFALDVQTLGRTVGVVLKQTGV